MKMSPLGYNNYSAKVNLYDVEGDFKVHFYEEEDKLVLVSKLTKSSWNIRKLTN